MPFGANDPSLVHVNLPAMNGPRLLPTINRIRSFYLSCKPFSMSCSFFPFRPKTPLIKAGRRRPDCRMTSKSYSARKRALDRTKVARRRTERKTEWEIFFETRCIYNAVTRPPVCVQSEQTVFLLNPRIHLQTAIAPRSKKKRFASLCKEHFFPFHDLQ